VHFLELSLKNLTHQLPHPESLVLLLGSWNQRSEDDTDASDADERLLGRRRVWIGDQETDIAVSDHREEATTVVEPPRGHQFPELPQDRRSPVHITKIDEERFGDLGW
jgi:hypothetical protein